MCAIQLPAAPWPSRRAARGVAAARCAGRSTRRSSRSWRRSHRSRAPTCRHCRGSTLGALRGMIAAGGRAAARGSCRSPPLDADLLSHTPAHHPNHVVRQRAAPHAAGAAVAGGAVPRAQDTPPAQGAHDGVLRQARRAACRCRHHMGTPHLCRTPCGLRRLKLIPLPPCPCPCRPPTQPPLPPGPALCPRYLAGTDVLELCAAADFPPVLMLRRMLEHMLGLSKQVGVGAAQHDPAVRCHWQTRPGALWWALLDSACAHSHAPPPAAPHVAARE